MRAVIQRVKCASVTVDKSTVASIGRGLLVLLGVEPGDAAEDIDWLAHKVATIRLFEDDKDGTAWGRSVGEIGGSVLVVSQFTLFASTKKGTKPSWHRAAKPEIAKVTCSRFAEELGKLLPSAVAVGRFGAMMDVELVNDGPVTLLIDTRNRE